MLFVALCMAQPAYAVRVGSGDPILQVSTTKGDFKMIVFQHAAPITSTHFLKLVDRQFYNGLTFHRYEPDFVIQGGDPKGDGTGGATNAQGKPETIALEKISWLKHDAAGVVAMARAADPNSASSQFYVALRDLDFLDNPPGYAVFGRVIDGLPVVMKLRRGDKILSMKRIGSGDAKAYLKGHVEKYVNMPGRTDNKPPRHAE